MKVNSNPSQQADNRRRYNIFKNIAVKRLFVALDMVSGWTGKMAEEIRLERQK